MSQRRRSVTKVQLDGKVESRMEVWGRVYERRDEMDLILETAERGSWLGGGSVNYRLA